MRRLLKKLLYLHPLLFTLYLPLFLYNHNINTVWPGELALVIAVAFAITIVLWLIALSLCRLRFTQAFLLTSYWLIICALYLPVKEWYGTVRSGWMMHLDLHAELAILALIALIRCAFFTDRRFEHRFLLILGTVLVGYNLTSIARSDSRPRVPHAIQTIAPDLSAAKRKDLPNIIYIVPDRYPSHQVLHSAFQYDNQPFISALQRRNFYVQDPSFASYTKTFESLASVFNMQYINFLAEEFGRESSDARPTYYLLQHNQGFQILKKAGYHIVNMANWWEGTRKMPVADENFSNISRLSALTEFQRIYLENHAIFSLFRNFYNPWGHYEDCRFLPIQFNKLRDIMGRDEPQFVFWHIYLPHPPFIFDSNGKCLDHPISIGNSWSEHRDAFLGHLQYANKLLLETFDMVQAQSKRDFIFIIQSDEGPFPWSYIKNYALNWFEVPPDLLRMKFGNINAIYFPSGHYGPLQGQITPINNFRLLLNEALGTTLPTLEHHSYVFRSELYPYDFKEITPLLTQPMQDYMLQAP